MFFCIYLQTDEIMLLMSLLYSNCILSVKSTDLDWLILSRFQVYLQE